MELAAPLFTRYSITVSDYLRDVLGAGNPYSAQPLGLVADSGPDIPGGEGANKGFWRRQLKDRLMRFAKMYGDVLFDVEIENIGRVSGHGQIIDAVASNIALVRIKNHPILGDMDLPIPSTQFEVVDAIIPDADFERVTGKELPKPPAPELKDEVTGDEAMQVIRNAGAEYAKSQGRFAMARTYNDIEQGLRAQYLQFFDEIKKDNPDLLKNRFIINKDGTGRMGDVETEDDFWGAITAQQVGTGTRWTSLKDLDPFAQEVNRKYAEKFLGVKKDGLITFYRNVLMGKDDPAEAAAGYASLDKKMAWDYNPSPRPGDTVRGRYIVKAKPDEVQGILGFSGALDEFGVVISPDVTSMPGRFERVGDMEKQRVETAPWLDSTSLDSVSRLGGNSPFRFLAPMANFDYYALDSNPFGEGTGWSSFYEANGLEQGAIPNKYNELYGEGSWEENWKNGNPESRRFADLFIKFTDEDGKEKWGLDAVNLRNLSNQDMLNNADSGDDFDRNIKLLSTMQELMGTPFFVNKGHSKDDPRLDEVKDEEPALEVKPGLLETDITTGDVSDVQNAYALMWTGNDWNKVVNKYLRFPEEITEKDRKDVPGLESVVEQLTQATKNNKFKKDQVLLRRVGLRSENLKVGDIVEDPGFQSTTKSSKIGTNVGTLYEPFEDNFTDYKIYAKKGQSGLDLEKSSFGPAASEEEVLLPPGTKFRVISVSEVPHRIEGKKGNTLVEVEIVDETPKPASSGLTVNGRSELRAIKTRLGGEIFDTTAIKLIDEYSGSDADVKKLDAALSKEGIYRKRDLSRDGYVDAVRSAISNYKKIDPNLNTERKAKRARYGLLNGTDLGVIGYLQPANFTRFDNFDFSYASDKNKLSAAREEINKNGFTNPVTILYDPNTDEFTLENPEDSLKILATREIKDPNIKIRAIPTVVRVSSDSDSFDKDTELNPVFFYELNQPSAWVADIKENPGEYYDLSGIEPLPIPDRTDFEKEAIDFYQRGTYLTLKNYLKDPSSAGDDSEKLGKIVDTLNKLGNSEKLPANTALFRGFKLSADSDLYRHYSSLKSGDVLADPNRFASTSLDPLVAEDFATLGGRKDDYTGSVILEISTEDGATGVVFDNNKDTYSGVEAALASEKEVLLPFAAELKIDKIFKDSDGILRIQAKYGKKTGPADDAPEERSTGLFNEYSSDRADEITAEDTPLTDLGWEPWEEITIYRGVPDDVDSINPGDWVTTLPQLAKDYAGANGKVVSTKVKASELYADPSSGEGAYTEEMVWRPKPIKETPPRSEAKPTSIDMTGTRLSSEVKEELNSLISNFNIASTEAQGEAYREIAAELGRTVSLPWDKERTPEGRETYEYIYSAQRFKKATPENEEEKELLRIKNLFEEKVDNNKDLQEAKKTLYSNKIYKDVVDALSSEINDFDEDYISFGLLDVGRNLSRPRPRLRDDEIEEFLIESPDYSDEEMNELTYDVTVDIDESVEITNKDLKEFSETADVSIILPSRALEEVLNEGRMKTVHETKYSQAGNSSEEYRALRVAYESLAFGYDGDSPMEERPVYGLLRSATLPMPEDALMIYGGGKPAQIVLKPEAKNRTTISDRDSLNLFEPTTPLTDPKFEASHLTRMAAVYREATGENFFETENFAKFGSIEAQVHGGVKLEDIGKVVFYETPSEEMRELLTSKGIIWEVSRNKPYSKPRTFGGGIF